MSVISSVLPVSSPLFANFLSRPFAAWSISAMRPCTGSLSSKTWVTSASVSMVANGWIANVICMILLSPPVVVHRFFSFPASFLVALVLAAVPRLLALRQRDFDFCQAVAEVDAQRNNGQALGLRAASELMNFILMQEELARTERLVVPRTAGHVLRNVCVNQPCAAGLEIDIGIADIRFPFAQGLHLGAMQDQAGLKSVQQVKIVGGGAILGNNLLAGFASLLGFLRGLRHNLPS